MKHRLICLTIAALAIGSTMSAQSKKKAMLPTPPVTTDRQTMWDTKELFKVPKAFPCPEFLKNQETAQIKGVQLESVPFKGKITKIFAWYGLPKGATAEKPVPGIVLVHGGCGTALKSWVDLWLKRGYAAIAIATSANHPIRDQASTAKVKPWRANPEGGAGIAKRWANVDKPVKDQWTYHAVAAIIKAHSFLRSLPGVDKDKTGLTGISWGGYLSNITSGVDDRFKFVAPVYGCGFYGEDSVWRGHLLKMGDKGVKWIKLWDAGRYTPFATMPMLFCNGTNDHFFHMPSWLKTAQSVKGPRTLCLKIRMPHAHPPAGDPPEITAFADHILKGKAPLAKISKQGRDKQVVWAEYECVVPVIKANLCFTKSTNPVWEKRKWESIAASVDAKAKRVKANIPEGTSNFYLNLIDENGMIVSTEYEENIDLH